MIKTKKKKLNLSGFTLIELLVVVAIIGVLFTLIVIKYVDAKKSARDSRRITDIESIRSALEGYYDEYGNYPQSYGGGGAECGGPTPNIYWCNSYESLSGHQWILDKHFATTNLAYNLSEFMSEMPIDPKPAQPVTGGFDPGAYYYASSFENSKPRSYMIVFILENSNNPIKYRDGTYLSHNNGGTRCCIDGHDMIHYNSPAGKNYLTITLGNNRGNKQTCNMTTLVGGDGSVINPANVCQH